MPTKTTSPLSEVGNFFQSPKFHSITRHFIQEPTKASFSRRLESMDVIPGAYKDFFRSILSDGHEFPYTILTPTHNGYKFRSVEKLVCGVASEIHILEKRGDTFADLCFPVTEISYLEVRAVLLDSSIKFTGITNKGEHTTSIVQFNSVTDYLFAPIMKKIRGFNADFDLSALRAEMKKFDKWQRSNFKFMNYARNSLLGGERVITSVLQPEIRANDMKILGITHHKTISPAHASILTDQELIMIREEIGSTRKDRYGGIWDYIPLNKIVTLSLRGVDDNMIFLSIQLPNDVYLEFLYQEAAKKELDILLSHFKKLTS